MALIVINGKLFYFTILVDPRCEVYIVLSSIIVLYGVVRIVSLT